VTALAQRNARTGFRMALLALAMVGLAFASVPLYRLFCQVTGFGGATVRAAEAPGAAAGEIGVRFDANIDPALPWKFEPAERVRVRLGERTVVNQLHRPTDHRPRHLQRHASPGRPLLQQDRMLLLHRADAESRRERGYAGCLLHRPQGPRGGSDQSHRRDHPELHILPGGKAGKQSLERG
jgi:hypothetical protein